jgi:hypothetical protein
MANNYTTIKLILDKILRNPMMRDLTLEAAVDYTIDFIRIVGVPSFFEDKVKELSIENYRAKLPCDFYEMNQVRSIDNGYYALRYTTDTFHMSPNKSQDSDITYKIQGGIIYTSIETGNIEISYQAIPVDKEGYPLIPDNSDFTRALELYIKVQWYTILFEMSKLPIQVLQNTKQDYAWAVGACESEFQRLSLDKMEAFSNSFRTLILRDTQHKTGFKHNGTREYLKVH